MKKTTIKDLEKRIEKLGSESTNKPHNIKGNICDNQELMDFYNKIKPDLLTPEEKEYLQAVIKPFMDKINYIYKLRKSLFIDTSTNIYNIPTCEKFTQLEEDKKYTLEELGL